MSNQVAVGDVMTASNINDIERRKPTSAVVATAETTTSTTYVNLPTSGPAVTVTTGASVLIWLASHIFNSGANATYAAVAVSGATTRAPADSEALRNDNSVGWRTGIAVLITGLTPGSNTFTIKYKVGAGTGNYENRAIVVIPQD